MLKFLYKKTIGDIRHMQISIQKRVSVLVILALFFGALVALPIRAQQVEEQTPTESTGTTDDESEDRRATLEERKEQRKAEIELRRDTAREQRVAGRCTGAQNALEARQGASEQILAGRQQVYGVLLTKLDELEARLANVGADTTTLQEQITEISTLVDEFYVSFGEYQQALADMLEIDCSADVESFVFALEDAREQIKQLRETSKSIREFFTGTILQTMQDIKAELPDTDSGEVTEEES